MLTPLMLLPFLSHLFPVGKMLPSEDFLHPGNKNVAR